jgi:hypothetical protein
MCRERKWEGRWRGVADEETVEIMPFFLWPHCWDILLWMEGTCGMEIDGMSSTWMSNSRVDGLNFAMPVGLERLV